VGEEKKLNLTLIGCGGIADAHLRAVKVLEPRVELISTVDIDETRARAAAEKYEAAYWTTDYEKALSDEAVDAAILCLPHDLHAPVAIAAAEAGLHAAEGWQMVRRFEEADRVLMVGHSRRFTPGAAQVRKIIQNGELGTVFHVHSSLLSYIQQASTAWRRRNESSGGYLIPIFGTHLIDLLLWVTDLVPLRVYCEYSSYRPEWEGDDEVSITLALGDKEGREIPASVQMSANCRMRPSRPQNRDELIVGGVDHTLIYNNPGRLFLDGDPLPLEPSEEAALPTFARQLQEFVQAIDEGRAPVSSGHEAARVMEVLDAAQKSATEHVVVELNRDDRK
jgi:UDP-N-acetylglucosamine 3-dehydrogenase